MSIIQGLSRKRLFAHHSLSSPLVSEGGESNNYWNENVALNQNISLKALKNVQQKFGNL